MNIEIILKIVEIYKVQQMITYSKIYYD